MNDQEFEFEYLNDKNKLLKNSSDTIVIIFKIIAGFFIGEFVTKLLGF